MEKPTWEEFELFIRKEAGTDLKKPLAKSHAVERDLDVTGDDAIELMEHFFDRFSVKVGDFDFNRYFSGEGFNPFEITLMIFSKKTRKKYDKERLTLGMLYQAILDGEWNCKRLENVGISQ